ncbi:hypothetical protein [Caulobacter sp. 17J65-9]|uniref:hypothetical protein n=1 Tax=Caulobacter sp. 17J65-9 TaxID=2709382 RepID=UPI0013C80C7A|nr:hypothetical protein [Caulobacter sp. 17J65-9]NEX91817.1 hypothetical protein [Caulobacter sp. 17J65-9]
MTNDETNGDGRFFMTLGLRRLALLTLAAAAAGLSGCATGMDPFKRPTDPHSAAAADVDRMVAAQREFPRWSKFPKAPQDVPPPAEFAVQVASLQASQNALITDAGKIQWYLKGDTRAWAQSVRSVIDPQYAQPAPPNAAAEAAAWARELREKAVPPPVAK